MPASLTFIVGFFILAPFSQASHLGPNDRGLADLVRASSPQSLIVYDHQNPASSLPSSLRQTLQVIAEKQSRHWTDTILENDYQAESAVRLDRAEALYSAQTRPPIAYRISYSARAWYTADCQAPRTLDGCEEGRIHESSFVSASGLSWLRDESAYADFVTSRPDS